MHRRAAPPGHDRLAGDRGRPGARARGPIAWQRRTTPAAGQPVEHPSTWRTSTMHRRAAPPYRLMAVARDERLSNGAHVHHLPPSWGTLYELTKLDDDGFAQALGDGTIRPDMQRRDIAQKTKKRARALKEQAPRRRPGPAWCSRSRPDRLTAPHDAGGRATGGTHADRRTSTMHRRQPGHDRLAGDRGGRLVSSSRPDRLQRRTTPAAGQPVEHPWRTSTMHRRAARPRHDRLAGDRGPGPAWCSSSRPDRLPAPHDAGGRATGGTPVDLANLNHAPPRRAPWCSTRGPIACQRRTTPCGRATGGTPSHLANLNHAPPRRAVLPGMLADARARD